ncbi:MAG: hypothetical protein HYV19_12625 [Gemmatimonadetes bacterium]|nr:hypothetical protein [Gemmatimonadota bacterium]
MSPDDLFKRPYPDENYVPPDEADLRKQALQRAYEIAQSITTEQAREAQAAQTKAPVDRGPLLRALNAALAVGVAVFLFAAPPDWLPQGAPDRRTPEQREMGLRVVLAFEAARVNAYREAEGRLPETLAEAGGDTRAVRYTAVDATRFTLSASDGASSLSYDSTEPLDALLGGTGSPR